PSIRFWTACFRSLSCACKGYSWKWLGGVSVAFLVMFCVLGWGMKTMLDRNYNATAAVYQKVVILEDKLPEKPVTGKNRKN
ncbi:hypothetical protein FQF77_22795, partial [Escherichia coli]|nr:hypothetical protein [Escherichia coli]EFN5684591.1 hypothetical protein [Escherichia coli]